MLVPADSNRAEFAVHYPLGCRQSQAVPPVKADTKTGCTLA